MKILGIALLAALGGCGQINGLRTDLSSRPVVQGSEEQALINNLMIAYQNCSRQTVPCQEFKTAAANSNQEVLTFVEAGMTLSDFYCDSFFRNTNQAARKRRFSRNLANDVGGAVATVLGLAKAGSGVVGGVASGFSFLDGSFRNYDESFLVDADLSKVRRLVLAAQDNMKEKIYAAPPKSFFAGESTIIRYAGLCSFLGMQDLLNESVSEKTARIEHDNAAKRPPGNGDGNVSVIGQKETTNATAAGQDSSVQPDTQPASQVAPAPPPGPRPAIR